MNVSQTINRDIFNEKIDSYLNDNQIRDSNVYYTDNVSFDNSSVSLIIMFNIPYKDNIDIYYAGVNYYYLIDHVSNTVNKTDINNNQKETLFKISDGNIAFINACDNKYIIWTKDKGDNYMSTSLFLYITETKTNNKVYDYSINPSTGENYAQYLENILLYNNLIYFSDIGELDATTNKFKINLYVYDITNGLLK